MLRVDVGATELAYWQRGSGTPLLLIHGFPFSHTMWAAQLKGLAADSRVIAPDLPGFGRSPRMSAQAQQAVGAESGGSTASASTTPRPAAADPLTMGRLAELLSALLRAVGVREPVVVCGLSMGGYIALQFCQRYPDRVRALILCDTRAAADPPATAAAREDLAEQVVATGATLLADSMIPRLLAAATCRHRPDLVARVRQMIATTDPLAAAAALRGMACRPDMTGLLDQIRVPTLVIVGQHDQISTPPEMRAVAAAIAQADYVEVPAAGHLAPMENPRAFNRAVRRFLRAAPC